MTTGQHARRVVYTPCNRRQICSLAHNQKKLLKHA
jgi:hypothetical protein